MAKKPITPPVIKKPVAAPVVLDQTMFKKAFFIVMAVLLLLVPMMSLKTGINGDERFQVFIARYIVPFYTSFGEDRRVLLTRDEVMPAYQQGGMEAVKEKFNVDMVPQENNLKNYGGLFELTSAVVSGIFGYDSDEQVGFHTVRHILLGLITVFIMLFAGLIAKELLGWRAALITILLLAISPRFIGHGIMNNKDIPFALGYIMSLYFMIRFIKGFPVPDFKSAIGFAGGLAIAMGVRVGGLMIVMEFGLFCLIAWFYFKSSSRDAGYNNLNLRNSIIKAALACIVGYIAGVFFWPYGLLSPIDNPLAVLEEQSAFPVFINQLFEGQVVSSKDLPWYYLSKFIVITSPLVVLLGVLLSIYLMFKNRGRMQPLLIALVLFVILFPLLYISYKRANVYNGWRHVLFIYPALVVLAAIGWDLLLDALKKPMARYAALAVMLALAILPASFIAANTAYAYVYFNPLTGGIKGAYGQYVTDYWMIGTREATEWLIENELPKAQGKLLIASDCVYPVQVYLNKVKDKATLTYSRYYDRTSNDWDYGIFYSEYVNPYQLQNGLWPPDGTIYEVKAGGVPICAVVKRSTKADYEGMQAIKAGNFQKAAQDLEKAKAAYPKNEVVHANLGIAYLNLGNVPLAVQSLTEAVRLNAEDAYNNYLLGIAYANSQPPNYGETMKYMKRALKINPGFTQAQQVLNQLNQSQGGSSPFK